MRISDWSSDVCSSDLQGRAPGVGERRAAGEARCDARAALWAAGRDARAAGGAALSFRPELLLARRGAPQRPSGAREPVRRRADAAARRGAPHHAHVCRADDVRTPSCASRSGPAERSEEHTSELQSLMRISYSVFCLTIILFLF